MASKLSHSGSEVRVVLVGQEKVGKSSSGNTIMGRKEFDCRLGFAAVTLKSEKAEGVVFNRRVTVVDTPGLYNSKLSEEQQEAELEEALLLSAPGPHVFLYVVQLGRFTEQERKAMKTLERILSSDVGAYIIVLFTYGDRLEDTDIDQFIREDENLKKLVDKCGGNYHVFNNKDIGNRDQVRELLEQVDLVSERRYRYYVRPPSAKGDWVKSWLLSTMLTSLSTKVLTVRRFCCSRKGLLCMTGAAFILGCYCVSNYGSGIGIPSEKAMMGSHIDN